MLGIHRVAVLQQAGAEGRHLRKDHFAHNAIGLEFLDADRHVPFAPARRERAFAIAEHGKEPFVLDLTRGLLHQSLVLARIPGLGR